MRNVMRTVVEYDWPRPGEEGTPLTAGPLPMPKSEEVVMQEVSKKYNELRERLGVSSETRSCRSVEASELRCFFAKLHYGMSNDDPTTRIVFHDLKQKDAVTFLPSDSEAKPMREKIVLYWNPSSPADEETSKMLKLAFGEWANSQVQSYVAKMAVTSAMWEVSPSSSLSPSHHAFVIHNQKSLAASLPPMAPTTAETSRSMPEAAKEVPFPRLLRQGELEVKPRSQREVLDVPVQSA